MNDTVTGCPSNAPSWLASWSIVVGALLASVLTAVPSSEAGLITLMRLVPSPGSCWLSSDAAADWTNEPTLSSAWSTGWMVMFERFRAGVTVTVSVLGLVMSVQLTATIGPRRQGVADQGHRQGDREAELRRARDLRADQRAQRRAALIHGLGQLIERGGAGDRQRALGRDRPRAVVQQQGDGGEVGRAVHLARRAGHARLDRRVLDEDVLLQGVAGERLPVDRARARDVGPRDAQVGRRVRAVDRRDGEGRDVPPRSRARASPG